MHYMDLEETAMLAGIDAGSAVLVLGELGAPPGVCEPPDCFPPIQYKEWDSPPSAEEQLAQAEDDLIAGGVSVPAMKGGWPAPVPIYIPSWNFSAKPATYQITQGDTLSGLAYTYLGSHMRWNELWAFQTPQFRANNTPDKIYPGQKIRMPAEAAKKAKKFAKKQKLSYKGKNTIAWVVGGTAAALAVGAGVYYYSAG